MGQKQLFDAIQETTDCLLSDMDDGAALYAGATHFFTNDIRLPDIPSIQILSLDSLI
jgi:hypothetical protein